MSGANKYRAGVRDLLCLLGAVAVTMALHISAAIPAGSGESLLTDMTARVEQLFTGCQFTDLVVCAAVWLLIRYTARRDKAVDVWSAALALCLALMYVVAQSFLNYDGTALLTLNPWQAMVSVLWVAGLGLLFYFCLRWLEIFLEARGGGPVGTRAKGFLHEHFLLCFSLAIFLCWLPWILMDYPGSYCYDSRSQLYQFLGLETFTAHHPPLSTYIMGLLAAAGRSVWNMNFGCFLYQLLQTCLGAWIFGFGIRKLYDFGLGLSSCVLIAAFFGLTPLWGCSAQWYEKDLLYTEIATWYLICAADVALRRTCGKKDMALLAVSGLLSALLRNSGIYVVIPTAVLLAVYVRRPSRRAVWLSLAAAAVLYAGAVKVLYPRVLGIQDGSVAEALSVPFQQTARYVSEYPDEVTGYEREVIDSVLEYDALSQRYNPEVSDPVKITYRGDGSRLPEYFKVWFLMFLKHPMVYVSAFLNGSYGYMAPVEPNLEAVVFMEYGENLTRIGLYRVTGRLPAAVFTLIRSAGMTFPLVRYLCMPGLYTWITLVCLVLLAKRKIWGPLILFVPELMALLVCAASPLPNAIRYALPVAAAAPLLMGWTACLLARHRAERKQ